MHSRAIHCKKLEGLVSDIPAGDENVANLFLKGIGMGLKITILGLLHRRPTWFARTKTEIFQKGLDMADKYSLELHLFCRI
jgi:hypothetical protein